MWISFAADDVTRQAAVSSLSHTFFVNYASELKKSVHSSKHKKSYDSFTILLNIK